MSDPEADARAALEAEAFALHQAHAAETDQHAGDLIGALINNGMDPAGVVTGVCAALVRTQIVRMRHAGIKPTVREVLTRTLPLINHAAEQMLSPKPAEGGQSSAADQNEGERAP